MADFIRLDPSDNVVTVTRPVEAGFAIETVAANAMIPRGHKVAVAPIPKGAERLEQPPDVSGMEPR